MTDAPPPTTGSMPVVRGALVAVVVTRGLTPWLAATLDAVAAQTRPPTRVLVVDAGPRADPAVGVLPPDDVVARLARRALDDVAPLWTLAVPGARTFGDAVRRALAVPGAAAPGPASGVGDRRAAPAGQDPPGDPAPAAPRTGAIPTVGRPPEVPDWLWLLHDDSAPEPDALSELVRAVEHTPSVAIAGVKQRSWDDPPRLLEVGLTTSRLGRRMTGIEEGEVDQGQHDGREDVLGVGLAGALVRRDVWAALDGPDPALGPFGDGLDLCRRARLAGHRVVVVPRAVVRHVQASYVGLRDDDLRHVVTGAAVHDPVHGHGPGTRRGHAPGTGPARTPDPRRSFAARRRARIHASLASVPLPLVPLLTIAFLAIAVVRSLVRIAAKDGVLVASELAAPVAAILNPGRMARSRAGARRARHLPRRSLRVLQKGWREVVRDVRDRALTRSGERRVVQAPSELELAELAALTSRRRLGLATLTLVLGGLTTAVLGPLVLAAARGETLVGGGLVPVDGTARDLWRALTLGWVPSGLGVPAPADPLLAVLLPFAALTGSARGAVGVVFLGGLLVAGLGAWFAAGAATRSVRLRLWAVTVWVAAPALLLALDGGRLGAVVAHAALPWVALGVARALGLQREDVVVPGHVTARVGADGEGADGDRETGDGPGAAATGALATGAGATDDLATGHLTTDDLATGHLTTDDLATDAPRPDGAREPTVGSQPTGSGATAVARDAVPGTAVADGAPGPAVGAARAGSVTAAAAAGLGLAAAVAGAPVLLPAGLLALLVVALLAGRGRGRHRLLLVAIPALTLAGPLLADVVGRADEGGWRALVAEPGLPVASTAAPAWQQLLGRPTVVAEDAGAVLGLLLGGTVALVAVLALLRRGPVARGVLAGWTVAACGLVAAVVTGRVATGVVEGAVVRGWPGAGVSLTALGLLTAALLGADGMRDRVLRPGPGWRRVTVGGVAVLAVLVPLASLTEWGLHARPAAAGGPASAGAPVVRAVEGPVVPAVGQQAQTSEARSRVLALGVGESGEVRYTLLRGDGPQLTERSAAAGTRTLAGPGGSGDGSDDGSGAAVAPAPTDAATREVETLVARLATGVATGAAGDVADDLGRLAVGAVLVPPAAAEAEEPARTELVGRLDATGGLERITENPSGVIWRVTAPAPELATGTAGADPVTAWARLVGPPAGADDPAVAAPPVAPLASTPLGVRTTIPAGADGRTVVLAERADDGWRAWLDGRRLPSVDAGWRQAFAVDGEGGALTVAHGSPGRTAGWVVQVVVLGLTVLLALPVRRRRGGPR